MKASVAKPRLDREGHALLARIQAYQANSLGALYRRDAGQAEERIAQNLQQIVKKCAEEVAVDLEKRLRADFLQAPAFPEGIGTLTVTYGVPQGSAAAKARKALAPLLPILYLTAFSWGAYIVCEAASAYAPKIAAAALQGAKSAR